MKIKIIEIIATEITIVITINLIKSEKLATTTMKRLITSS